MTSALSLAVLGAASASGSSSVTLVQPDEFYFDATGKTVQAINTGGGTATDSGHKLIGIQSGGGGGDVLKIKDSTSGIDSTRVVTTDATSGAIALYLVAVASGSGAPPSTTPAFANAVVYQAFRYRELSYSPYTTNGDPNDSCLMITFNSTDSSTADSGNHIKSYYGKLVATTITNGGSETAEGTYSGLTDPGNGWRFVEFAIDRTAGLCVIKDWNGGFHTYSDSLLIDSTSKYPVFEWFVNDFSNRHRYELQKMWASTAAAMSAGQTAYYNKIFTDAGQAHP